MAQKISTLDETLLSVADKTMVDQGFIPIVVSLGGQLINKKMSLVNYWTYILQLKVIDTCEEHKSIYNFGGDISTGGGTGGASASDILVINGRLETLENFKNVTVPNTYVTAASVNDIRSTANANATAIGNLQTSITNLNNIATDYNTKKLTKLYIRVVDKYGTQVNGYSFDIDSGLSSNITLFPATGVIELKTDELARAMYHVELNTAVHALYDTSSSPNKYVITIGQLNITKPSNTTTDYLGGTITDARVTIDPSWTGAPTLDVNLTLNNGVVGTYNFSFEYESATDKFIDNEFFAVTVKIGNWEQVFTLSPNITITGNISTDITAPQ